MVRGLDLRYLLHVLEPEHEDVVFAGHVQVRVVDVQFDDLGEEGDAECWLVGFSVVNRDLPLPLRFLLFPN